MSYSSYDEHTTNDDERWMNEDERLTSDERERLRERFVHQPSNNKGNGKLWKGKTAA